MPDSVFETISTHRCFGGTVGFYKHQASTIAGAMRFHLHRRSPAPSRTDTEQIGSEGKTGIMLTAETLSTQREEDLMRNFPPLRPWRLRGEILLLNVSMPALAWRLHSHNSHSMGNIAQRDFSSQGRQQTPNS
jgi:hypothetical protein